jgi:hypothetical protein
MSHNIQISAPTPKLFVESRKRDWLYKMFCRTELEKTFNKGLCKCDYHIGPAQMFTAARYGIVVIILASC